MKRHPATGLPTMPSGGNRRVLEKLWLDRLEESRFQGSDLQVPESPPDALVGAVSQFNEARYWDCHETLEDLWRPTRYPMRFFYHGLLKAAVGFHHLSRHNRNGATIKLSDADRLLALFQPEFLGVRTGLLKGAVAEWLARLDEDGRVDWAELDALPRPVIRTEWGAAE